MNSPLIEKLINSLVSAATESGRKSQEYIEKGGAARGIDSYRAHVHVVEIRSVLLEYLKNEKS